LLTINNDRYRVRVAAAELSLLHLLEISCDRTILSSARGRGKAHSDMAMGNWIGIPEGLTAGRFVKVVLHSKFVSEYPRNF
jgi:hypothetical protein